MTSTVVCHCFRCCVQQCWIDASFCFIHMQHYCTQLNCCCYSNVLCFFKNGGSLRKPCHETDVIVVNTMQKERKKKGSCPAEFFMWVGSFRHSRCFTPVCCMQHLRADVWVRWEEVERGGCYFLSWYHCSLGSDCMCWQAQGRPAFLGRLRSGVKSGLHCSWQERNPKTSAFWSHCRLQLGDTHISMGS